MFLFASVSIYILWHFLIAVVSDEYIFNDDNIHTGDIATNIITNNNYKAADKEDTYYRTIQQQIRSAVLHSQWSDVETIVQGEGEPVAAKHRVWWHFARGVAAQFR